MVSVVKTDYNISGLQVQVYTASGSISTSLKRAAVLFLLHGRHGSAKDVEAIARTLLEKSDSTLVKRNLYIATLDHRNHGERLVNPSSNNAWTGKETNDLHAMDMYSIQMGTARDVSLLIDFLPMYLFSQDENVVDLWGIAGISLGGHSAWISLSEEPRITVGIPIIGCPDYESLIRYRAQRSDVPFAAPYVPLSLVQLVQHRDPAKKNHKTLDSSNPFLGKKVLVLSGEEDKLVPWSASEKFVNSLEVGETGTKEVVIQKGVGHKCTPEMVSLAAEFVKKHVL